MVIAMDQIRRQLAEAEQAEVQAVRDAIKLVWSAVRSDKPLPSGEVTKLKAAMDCVGISAGHLALLAEVDRVARTAQAVVDGADRADLDNAVGKARAEVEATEARHKAELAEVREKLNIANAASQEHRLGAERLHRLHESLPAWLCDDIYSRPRYRLGHDLATLCKMHGITHPNGTRLPLPSPSGEVLVVVDEAPVVPASDAEVVPASEPPVTMATADNTDVVEKRKVRRKAAVGTA